MIQSGTLDQLRSLMRATIYYDKLGEMTARITVDTKQLKQILLETGGTFRTIAGGSSYDCKVMYKHLGVGVYNVWGKVIPK